MVHTPKGTIYAKNMGPIQDERNYHNVAMAHNFDDVINWHTDWKLTFGLIVICHEIENYRFLSLK